VDAKFDEFQNAVEAVIERPVDADELRILKALYYFGKAYVLKQGLDKPNKSGHISGVLPEVMAEIRRRCEQRAQKQEKRNHDDTGQSESIWSDGHSSRRA